MSGSNVPGNEKKKVSKSKQYGQIASTIGISIGIALIGLTHFVGSPRYHEVYEPVFLLLGFLIFVIVSLIIATRKAFKKK